MIDQLQKLCIMRPLAYKAFNVSKLEKVVKQQI